MSIPAPNLYPAYPIQAPTISIPTPNSRLSSNQSAAASGALIGAGAAGFWHVLSIPEIGDQMKIHKGIKAVESDIKHVFSEAPEVFQSLLDKEIQLAKSATSPAHRSGIIALSLGAAAGLGALISVGLNIFSNKKSASENPFVIQSPYLK